MFMKNLFVWLRVVKRFKVRMLVNYLLVVLFFQIFLIKNPRITGKLSGQIADIMTVNSIDNIIIPNSSSTQLKYFSTSQ